MPEDLQNATDLRAPDELEALLYRTLVKLARRRLSSRNRMRPWVASDRKQFLDDLAWVLLSVEYADSAQILQEGESDVRRVSGSEDQLELATE